MSFTFGGRMSAIAFATVVAETANGVVLAVLLHRRIGSPGWAALGRSIARSFAAALAMAAAALAAGAGAGRALAAAGAAPKAAQWGALAASLAVAAAVYPAVAAALRCPELRELADAVRRRRDARGEAPAGAGTDA